MAQADSVPTGNPRVDHRRDLEPIHMRGSHTFSDQGLSSF
jgi:hypothetical protein